MTVIKMHTQDLVIKNLHVSVEGQKILNGIDLTIKKGEVSALMGPNGSGKSAGKYGSRAGISLNWGLMKGLN